MGKTLRTLDKTSVALQVLSRVPRQRVASRWSQQLERCIWQIAQNPKRQDCDTNRDGLPGSKPKSPHHNSRERDFQKPKASPHCFQHHPGQNDDKHRVVLESQQYSTIQQMMNSSSASTPWTMQAGGQEEHTLWKERLPFTRWIRMGKHIAENRQCHNRDAEPTSPKRSLSNRFA